MREIYTFVDVVLLTLQDGKLKVALAIREEAPEAGVPTIPGGRIDVAVDENLRAAALRVLEKKTGIISPYMEPLDTFGGKFRDRRGWSISVVHYALVGLEVILRYAMEKVALFDVDDLPPLPFDHAQMIASAVSRLRVKGRYSSLPIYLAGEEFTLSHLQSIYTAVTGQKRHKSNFRDKMEELGVLEQVRGRMIDTGGAPAYAYRLKKKYRNQLATIDRGL